MIFHKDNDNDSYCNNSNKKEILFSIYYLSSNESLDPFAFFWAKNVITFIHFLKKEVIITIIILIEKEKRGHP